MKREHSQRGKRLRLILVEKCPGERGGGDFHDKGSFVNDLVSKPCDGSSRPDSQKPFPPNLDGLPLCVVPGKSTGRLVEKDVAGMKGFFQIATQNEISGMPEVITPRSSSNQIRSAAIKARSRS